MKKLKSILACSCMAAVAIFGFVGCGGNKPEPPPTDAVEYAQKLLSEYEEANYSVKISSTAGENGDWLYVNQINKVKFEGNTQKLLVKTAENIKPTEEDEYRISQYAEVTKDEQSITKKDYSLSKLTYSTQALNSQEYKAFKDASYEPKFALELFTTEFYDLYSVSIDTTNPSGIYKLSKYGRIEENRNIELSIRTQNGKVLDVDMYEVFVEQNSDKRSKFEYDYQSNFDLDVSLYGQTIAETARNVVTAAKDNASQTSKYQAEVFTNADDEDFYSIGCFNFDVAQDKIKVLLTEGGNTEYIEGTKNGESYSYIVYREKFGNKVKSEYEVEFFKTLDDNIDDANKFLETMEVEVTFVGGEYTLTFTSKAAQYSNYQFVYIFKDNHLQTTKTMMGEIGIMYEYSYQDISVEFDTTGYEWALDE